VAAMAAAVATAVARVVAVTKEYLE
jgi:hypothetical protein